MCGIAGLVGFKDEKLLREMLNVLSHRGPDDQAVISFGDLSLGYRRLAVIDLQTGDQPFWSEDKKLCLFYNGEIYNFKELRSALKERGHRFKTRSDGEVLVHGFEEWGASVFAKLNGMFAVALFDSSSSTLYLVRDYFGIKPLYYYFDERRHRLLFSSEIKPLLNYPHYNPQANEQIVYNYLVHRLHDHSDETFFAGIQKVLPGELLRISFEDGDLRIRRKKFWLLDVAALPHRRPRGAAELIEQFRFLLEDSVRLRLVSDVPVGVCLSGGLDSSTISLLIHELTSGPQKTFSAVFPGEANDESDYINVVNNKTAAQSFLIYPKSRGLFEDLESLVRVQEEPFISSGPYAQYCVMREASNHVKVLLDGQGGDELLAGYDPYFFVYLRQLLQGKQFSKFSLEALVLRGLILKFLRRRFGGSTVAVSDLLAPAFKKEYRLHETYATNETLKQRLHDDVFANSLPALLRYEDKNSSAFSLESRVPFLDPRLVEFIFSLPEDFLIRKGTNKFILRESVKDLLPVKIYNRRFKVGFTTPEDVWFRKEKSKILEIFRSAEFGKRPYWKQNEVLKSFDLFLDGKLSDSMVFWRLLNLEVWLRTFID